MLGKRGLITARPFFWIFDLVIVVAVLAAVSGNLYANTDSTSFEQTFLARDMALTINGMLHTRGHVEIGYDLGRDDLTVKLAGNRVYVQKTYEQGIQHTKSFPYIPLKGYDVEFFQSGRTILLTKVNKGGLGPPTQEQEVLA